MKYAILISAGYPVDYGPKVGWNDLHDTREGAEAQADRARRNSGWSAKVITLTEAEASHWRAGQRPPITRDEVIATLASIGFDASRSSTDTVIYVAVVDDGTTLGEIRAALPGLDVDWTGNGDTWGDGSNTWDIGIKGFVEGEQ